MKETYQEEAARISILACLNKKFFTIGRKTFSALGLLKRKTSNRLEGWINLSLVLEKCGTSTTTASDVVLARQMAQKLIKAHGEYVHPSQIDWEGMEKTMCGKHPEVGDKDAFGLLQNRLHATIGEFVTFDLPLADYIGLCVVTATSTAMESDIAGHMNIQVGKIAVEELINHRKK